MVVVALGHRTPGPVASSSNVPARAKEPATPQTRVFPAPPDGAVVFSREDGSNVLALAVVPGRRLRLQASVVDEQGHGVARLGVSFAVDGTAHAARACGTGCYAAVARGEPAPNRLAVRLVRTGGPMTWTVTMPRPWPPRDASSIVARATRAYRSLRTLAVHDRLGSDEQHVLVTHWQIAAPNRLAYQIENGSQGVIIGSRRWDKQPGQKWQAAAQTPIRQPTPFWESWKDAHVLAETPTAWRVSFYDPKTPGWYELLIAKSTMRPLEMKMNATAHFMRDAYGSFNAPLHILPPR